MENLPRNLDALLINLLDKDCFLSDFFNIRTVVRYSIYIFCGFSVLGIFEKKRKEAKLWKGTTISAYG